jgi:uncharacterized repeat protein (TIGR03803 family)
MGKRFAFCIAVIALAGCGGAQQSAGTIPQGPAIATHAEPPGSQGDASGHYLSRAGRAAPSTQLPFTDLFNFGGTNGSDPQGGLIFDASGALYGTTSEGGIYNRGAVFKLTPTGSGYAESVLYSFKGGANFKGATDGEQPLAGLIFDKQGALYGTTIFGGYGYGGTVFKLTPSGSGYTESVLYRFCQNSGCQDGRNPEGSLLLGKDGALYGTTASGGASGGVTFCWESFQGCGTVFKLTPSGSGYIESVLYSFCDVNGYCPGGVAPVAGLVFGKDGALYGTTSVSCAGLDEWCGTVFKLKRSGSRYTATTLYNCANGGYCNFLLAGVIFDKTGALWGTAFTGGGEYPTSLGSVFKLTPSGSGYTESFVYKFKGGTDGSNPRAGLTLGKDGVIYGTTEGGGSTLSSSRADGSGTVFKLTPSGSSYNESVIHRFVGLIGCCPMSGLIFDKGKTALYGTAGGGAAGYGTVFKLTL